MELSVEALDQQVKTFYEGRGLEQKHAEENLRQYRENPNAWLLVDSILSESTYAQSKYLALQILDQLIQTKWKILPAEQKHGIRNFIVGYIINGSRNEQTLQQERVLMNKLNLVLISILKQDWPHDWPEFISELVSSSRSNLSICENNMVILKLLSEEVFDFSSEQLTQKKTKDLKSSMCNEFSSVFQLCFEVLQLAENPALLKVTLEALLKFLNWIPLGYIFETSLISTLLNRFLVEPLFRNLTLKCITEIGALKVGSNKYDTQLVEMFTGTMLAVSKVLPIDTELRSVFPKSNVREQEFVLSLALFITSFFSTHLKLIEALPSKEILIHTHFYLIKISQIEDREVFKICLEYWNVLVQDLYEEIQQLPLAELVPMAGFSQQQGSAPHPSVLANYPLRKHQYSVVLSSLRQVMIEKMVRPEEVLIVENDEGEIVREFVRESDTIQLYKATRECLVYLTHLDVVDTEEIMSEKLARQVDGTEWSWANCNTLCWAIGSISGAMSEETEKRFLVTVIKDLLGLTEMKRGKDNKAVVASNIMYIVGQYPRFLKAHWKFLKTVVNKLFEFMHETHEGVQDMACDTFIKIASKCKRHFVAVQPGESEPFIDEIVRNMQRITCDLTPQQIHTFYEACGHMISAQGQKSTQERLIHDLMQLPNSAWDHIIQMAKQTPTVLDDAENVRVIGNVMKTNVAACSSIGGYFYPQIARIYLDMLSLYSAVSGMISARVAAEGTIATKKPSVRGLRTIKKEILKLVDIFIQKSEDLEAVNQTISPPLLDAILSDYGQNVPDARDAEVLNVVCSLVSKLHMLMQDKILVIMENVFGSTLSMINRDFSEYPEHRVAFFKLLRAINLHCFPTLLKLDAEQLRVLVDACLWAIKHDNRDVESAGLNTCLELVTNICDADPMVANEFFQNFLVPMVQDVIFVITDTDHRAGFKLQVVLFSRLISAVKEAKVVSPLQGVPASAGTTQNNIDLLRSFIITLLGNAFTNLNRNTIDSFVNKLFGSYSDISEFRLILRDFLVELREFSGDDTGDLYLEERENEKAAKEKLELERMAKVGGLIKPGEIDDDIL